MKLITSLFSLLLMLTQTSYGQVPRREWSTYLGGQGGDGFRDMVIDGVGNVYVVGNSNSASSVSTPTSFQSVNAGGSDVVIAKYDQGGSKIWATYFGGSADEFGQSIDLDASGNIFVTGLTFSSNGIATASSHKSNYTDGGDIFVAKFSSNGTRIWGSYLGGMVFDFANDIEVDQSGNAIIVGWTESDSGIMSSSPFKSTYSGDTDALVAKFGTNGNLVWATYVGNDKGEVGLQVESDGLSNIYISGWTASTAQIATPGAHQTAYGGNTADMYLMKFSPTGAQLWSSYFGGSGNDYGDALHVAENGDISLSGFSDSPNNISTPTSFQLSKNVGYDAVIARFNTDGIRQWSTYFGGNDDDMAYTIRASDDGTMYMVGFTKSTNVMGSSNAFQAINAGGQDAFLARFVGQGRLQWSTYFGGVGQDFGYGLCIGNNNDIFIAGNAEGSTTLGSLGSAQPNYGGGERDGFIAKFEPCVDPILNFNNSGFACGPVDYVFELELLGVPPFTIHYSIDGVAQTPWTTNSTDYFPTINANQWSKIIRIDSVKAGDCKGVVNSTFGFIQVRDSIRSTAPIIVCDDVTATYTVSCDLSGGAFGDFLNVGTTNGFFNNTIDRFVSSPIPYGSPYNITFVEAGTFSNCDSIKFMGSSPCTLPCPQITPVITSNSPLCTGASLTLSVTQAVTYQWSGPNSFTSSIRNPQLTNVTIAQAGTYSVTITDQNGCTGIQTANIVINQSPTPNITTNSPQCSGATLTFSASQASSYAWSGPNNFSSISQNPSIPNAQTIHSGTYTGTVTAANGCTNTSVLINILIHPKPIASISNIIQPCAGTNLTLMGSGGTTYAWTGPFNFQSTGQNPIITAISQNQAGIYRLIVSNSFGCMDSTESTISVLPKPLAIATANTPLCIGSTLRLQASGGTSYAWSGPSNFFSNLQNPTLVNAPQSAAGLYTVNVTSANGCTNSSSVNVDLSGQLSVSITSNSPICEGDSLILMANGGSQFLWTGPSGSQIGSGKDIIIPITTVVSQGTYSLQVTDASGCSGTRQSTVIVIPKPIATISSHKQVCIGETVTIEASGGDAYLWNNGSSTQQLETIVNEPTTFIVTVTTGICSDTAMTTISLFDEPSISGLSNISISQGDQKSIELDPTYTYSWTPADGISCIDCHNPIFSPSTTTEYCVTITNAEGCSIDSCFTIQVVEVCKLDLANIFSPNQDGKNDTWCTQVKECIAKQYLTIYDRWGNKLFTQEGSSVCWDGTGYGKDIQPQVCSYILSLDMIDGFTEYKTGTIMVVK